MYRLSADIAEGDIHEIRAVLENQPGVSRITITEIVPGPKIHPLLSVVAFVAGFFLIILGGQHPVPTAGGILLSFFAFFSPFLSLGSEREIRRKE